jgi:predicted ATPase with chaperone activity
LLRQTTRFSLVSSEQPITHDGQERPMWFLRRRHDSGEDADKALKEAEENLRIVQERNNEVTKIAKDLSDLRKKNHFAEQLEELLQPRKR